MGTVGKKPIDPIVAVVADNVRRRALYLARATKDNEFVWLRRQKVANGTVNRILKEESAIGIDTLVKVANVLGLSAYQLLIPHLDPVNPMRLPVTKEERQVAKTVALALNTLNTEGVPDENEGISTASPRKHLGGDADRGTAAGSKGGGAKGRAHTKSR